MWKSPWLSLPVALRSATNPLPPIRKLALAHGGRFDVNTPATERELTKGNPMQDLAELERRINAALQRIAEGIEDIGAGQAAAPAADAATEPAADTGRLKAELAAERARNAALRQELAAAQQAAAAPPAAPARPVPEGRAAQLARMVDMQALELQRMRKHVVQLRENLRNLRRAATDKLPDPDLINRAMQTELESIRVSRFAEMAELDEIIAELDPLITPDGTEVPEHA